MQKLSPVLFDRAGLDCWLLEDILTFLAKKFKKFFVIFKNEMESLNVNIEDGWFICDLGIKKYSKLQLIQYFRLSY